MWEIQFSKHQIGGSLEAVATALHGQGSRKGSVFHTGITACYRPGQVWERAKGQTQVPEAEPSQRWQLLDPQQICKCLLILKKNLKLIK